VLGGAVGECESSTFGFDGELARQLVWLHSIALTLADECSGADDLVQ
jgi:hypothetical protein